MSTLTQPAPAPPRPRMSTRTRFIFMLTAWAIVLLPFLFWRSTWFGRPLSDRQIAEYLHKDDKPRHIQHALVQIGERLQRGRSVAQWYPELVRLAQHPVEEIRNTDAWLMGQDNSRPEFHQALLGMLRDESPSVRYNAALSLVRFSDAAGHPQIVAMLQPAKVLSGNAGMVRELVKHDAAIRRGGMIARISEGKANFEVRSPITGRVHSLTVRVGDSIGRGGEIATISPGAEQVWEALRALYLIGRPEDLPAITPYTRAVPEMPDRVRQQALLTEKEILRKAGKL